MSTEPAPSARPRRAAWFAALVLAAPIAVGVLFVALYASPTPLTDEWYFLRSILDLEDLHLSQPDFFQRVVERGVWSFTGHSVVVPFLIYWLLGEAVGFDARVFIGVTLASFAALLVLYGRSLRGSPWAVLPIALVLFSPAHYTEFLWGFECTLALSIVFPIAGLAVLDTLRAESSRRACAWRLAAGIALILLGTLSSFGGFVGFAAAALLLALKPLGAGRQAALLTVLAVCGLAAYVWIVRNDELGVGYQMGRAAPWLVPTAVGGAVLSTADTLWEFGFDLRSAVGLVALAGLVAVACWACARRRLGHLAFPFSVAAFGLLATAAVALGRGHLANWHLQYALPIVCGAYMAAYRAWRADRSSWTTRSALAATTAVALSSVVGTYWAFASHGPGYRNYARDVGHYMQQSLADPEMQRPCNLAFDPDVGLYLSALGSSPFLPDRTDAAAFVPASGFQLFLNGGDYSITAPLGGPRRERIRVLVAWPTASAPRAARLRIGGHTLELLRIHPSQAQIGQREGLACFAGLLLPGTIPAGVTRLKVLVPR